MTTAFVLDASAAISWASPDKFPSASITDAILGGGAVAPALWIFEVHNVLRTLGRRKRLGESDWHAAADALGALSIELELPVRSRVENEVVRLAQDHGLTVYDAAYLELAIRRRLALATLDRSLVAVAKKVDVQLI